MARKGTATVEAPVESTEDTAAETSTTETETTETVDLSAFTSAAEASVTSQDYADVSAEYAKLDRKGKTAASRSITDKIKSLMSAKDATGAFAWIDVQESLKAAKAPKSEKAPREPKAPVDPTPAFIDHLAGLYLAYRTAASNTPDNLPEGTDVAALVKDATAAHQPGVDALTAWDGTGDAPEVSSVAARAVKLSRPSKGRKASTGTGSTYDGPRRSIAGHIAEAFAGHPSGTFLSVSDLRSFESAEYGSDHPSAGAISSALKSPKFAVEGVTPGTGGDKAVFGATKA